MSKYSICFTNKIHPIGGSGTFLKNFKDYLKKKNIPLVKLKNRKKIDFIFITGSNFRNLFLILKKKYQGSKVINRVDGKNWTYKYHSKNLIFYIFSYLQNLNVLFFQFLADKVIYQSKFIKNDWNLKFLNNKSIIIYNGSKPNYQKRDFSSKIKPTLISVEGSIDSAFKSENIISDIGKNYEYELYGKVSKNFKEKFKNFRNIKFYGQVPRSKIQKILKRKKKFIFISLEMHAPCPNSVIEAINYGVPVIGYNQGSMKEIISTHHGILINTDKNFYYKKSHLFKAINKISFEYKTYNKKLKNIDNRFKLNYMLSKYEIEISKT